MNPGKIPGLRFLTVRKALLVQRTSERRVFHHSTPRRGHKAKGSFQRPGGDCVWLFDESQSTVLEINTVNTKRLIKVMGAVFGAFSVVSAANGMQNLNEPEGACCYTDQAGALVCDMLTEHVCMDYMGVWSGAHVPCTDVDCADNDPGEGACCYEDADLGLVCDQLLQDECLGLNGYFYGAGVPCGAPQVECPSLEDMGACCYNTPDGWVCDLKIEEHCIDAGGVWYGPGSDCNDPQIYCSNEPLIGACCYEDPDLGLICAEMEQEYCLDLNGYYYGHNVVCSDPQVECDVPEKGACCYKDADNNPFCDELNQNDCQDLSGLWYGSGVPCTDPIVECGDVNDDPGACCYDDPDLGFICAMLIQEHCIDLNGYWYGAGVGCTDPQVECDLPSGDCIVQPGAECAGRPSYLDPNFSQVFGSGPVAVQTASPNIFQANVLTVFDLSNANTAPVDSWWSLGRYSDPDWNQNNLGSIFGLALDDDGDIFVTSTRSWNSDWPGIGGWGAIYRIDRYTGDITVFATLPNTNSGLGSITWDCEHQVFFVTNMEDGLIYQLDTNGNVLSTFDPALPWNGAAGPVALGDRPWAVEVHAGRLYFSMWNEHIDSGTNASSNEIWSVELDASGTPVGVEELEITIPSFQSTNWSSPVSDIRFSPRGTMLLAERSQTSFESLSAHRARLLEYECKNGAWVPGNTFGVGEIGGNNASGGVDADVARTWASGDALHLNHPAPYSNIYGFAGIPATGGDVTNSVLVDYQDNLIAQDKTMIGDLVVTKAAPEPCMNLNHFGTHCRFHHHNGMYHKVDFGFSAIGGGTIEEVHVTGPAGTTFAPGTLVGPFAPYQSYPVSVKMFNAPAGQQVCLTLTAVFADGTVCEDELCFVTPYCHIHQPGDVNADFEVDITDLLTIIENWGSQCDEQEDCAADQDADNIVGIGDLLAVLDNWTSR